MSKIPHRVVYCTSEEKDHSADELNTPSTESSGWISARFSEYPQEIGFQLIGRRPDIHLNQIQILNHQSKIATKVEVFIGSGLDYSTAIFKRLGFLSIDSNERSSYQARELKTVFVDVVGNFVKFRLQKNYLNEFNPFNQVGIVSVTFFGNENDQSLSASLPSSSVQLQSQIQHDVQPQSVSNSNHPFGINVKLDSTTLNKLKLIAEAKTKAIENEDYATAKVIKSIEVELKEMSLNLIEVDESKKSAVIAEDYDLAAELKEKGDKLRITMKQKIMSYRIPSSEPLPPEQLNQSLHQSMNQSMAKSMAQSMNQDRRLSATSSSIPSNIPSNGENFETNTGILNSSVNRTPYYSAYDERPVGVSPRKHVPENDYENDQTQPKSNPKKQGAVIAGTGTDVGYIPTELNEDDDVQFQTGSNSFPPGEHPLDGLDNLDLDNLPEPDDFNPKNRQMASQSGIIGYLGEYVAQCLYSRSWVLRDAAVNKSKLIFTELLERNPDIDPNQMNLAAVISIVKTGLDDKNLQVSLSSYDFLGLILSSVEKVQLNKSMITSMFDGLISQLIDKLYDGNQRVREGARKGLLNLATLASIGSASIAHNALKPLSSKQKTASKPLQARIILLIDLIQQFGMGNHVGLTHESIMQFLKANNSFAHSSGEVRDAAKELTILIQRHVGTPAIEHYLSELRPKQLEEYILAFEASDKYTSGPAGVSSVSPTLKKKQVQSNDTKSSARNNVKSSGYSSQNLSRVPSSEPTKSISQVQSRSQQKPGSSQSPSRISSANRQVTGSRGRYDDSYEEDFDVNEDSDDKPLVQNNNNNNNEDVKKSDNKKVQKSTKQSKPNDQDILQDANQNCRCQFCGEGDNLWTEDILDTHYLHECPYLAPCPACLQILEIASLPDHLLDECKFKDLYQPCEVTGLAIKISEMEKWMKSTACKPPPDNCFYCPMCLAPVIDDNEPWRTHLLRECKQNLRTQVV